MRLLQVHGHMSTCHQPGESLLGVAEPGVKDARYLRLFFGLTRPRYLYDLQGSHGGASQNRMARQLDGGSVWRSAGPDTEPMLVALPSFSTPPVRQTVWIFSILIVFFFLLPRTSEKAERAGRIW